MDKLTDSQIRNWRNILHAIIGPFAFIATDGEIQTIAENIQSNIDKEEENFISKTLSDEVDTEIIPHKEQNDTTFGDLIKESRLAKK